MTIWDWMWGMGKFYFIQFKWGLADAVTAVIVTDCLPNGVVFWRGIADPAGFCRFYSLIR